MAYVVIHPNPLDPSQRRLHEVPDGTPLLEWLDKHAQVPAQCTRQVFVNGVAFDPLTTRDAAYLTLPGDEVLVGIRPGDPATIGAMILQTLIEMAIAYVLSQIFAPTRPKAGNTPSPSQVYGIAPARNMARLGEPIPVVYGSVIALPDFAAQPYTEFVGNEQFMYALLCIGQGEHTVTEMLLGDSSATALPPEVATFTAYGPAAHASTFGVIQAATGVRENVVTSADVSNQELLAPNESSTNTPSTWYWQAGNVLYAQPSIPVGATDLTNALSDAQRLALLPANPHAGGHRARWLTRVHQCRGDHVHHPGLQGCQLCAGPDGSPLQPGAPAWQRGTACPSGWGLSRQARPARPAPRWSWTLFLPQAFTRWTKAATCTAAACS